MMQETSYKQRLAAWLLMPLCFAVLVSPLARAEDSHEEERRRQQNQSRPQNSPPHQAPAPHVQAPPPSSPHYNPTRMPQQNYDMRREPRSAPQVGVPHILPPQGQMPRPAPQIHYDDERNWGGPRPFVDHPRAPINNGRNLPPATRPPRDRPPPDWRERRGEWRHLDGDFWRPPAVYLILQNAYRFWRPPPPVMMRYYGPPLFISGYRFTPGCSERTSQSWDGGGWWHETTTEVCFADYAFSEPAGTYRGEDDCVVDVSYRFVGDVWWRRQVTHTCYFYAG